MRPFEGSFSPSGASKVDLCLADYTINTYGFNLRQGQLVCCVYDFIEDRAEGIPSAEYRHGTEKGF